MANETRKSELPDGHMRVELAIAIEGPAMEVTEQLVGLIKALPPEKQVEVGQELERRFHRLQEEARRKHADSNRGR